jgi:hypothetical protein
MWWRQKFRFGSLRMEWTSGHAKTQRRKGRKPKASYKSSDRMRTQIGSCERPMLCNPESSRDCAKNRRADHRSSCSDGISSAANHSNMAIFFASLRLCVRRRIGPNASGHRCRRRPRFKKLEEHRRRLRCTTLFVLLLVLVLSIAVLVLVLEKT